MCFQEWVQLIANIAIAMTFVVYCLLLRATLRQLRQSTEATHQSSRQHVWSELFRDFAHINDYLSGHPKIPKPPYPSHASSEETHTLLFHHFNLVFRYWLSRQLLEKEEIEGFERWIREVFFGWIGKDNNLQKDFNEIILKKDLYSENFIKWLSNMQPQSTQP